MNIVILLQILTESHPTVLYDAVPKVSYSQSIDLMLHTFKQYVEKNVTIC